MITNPKSIIITGASSGLGAALAIKYAGNGVRLYLTGRDAARLDGVKKQCEANGAKVGAKVVDVKEHGEISKWVAGIPDAELIIANAGISAGTGGGGESYEQVKNIFDTNIYGVINTIFPAIENMKKNGHGQIAIVSSLAGYRGIPSSPAYSASKAAVKVYGEAMRVVLAKDGVGLTVITPGYIKTPMTDVNNFYMPFLMGAEKAADIIVRRLAKNPARMAFPLPFYALVWLVSILPACVVVPILGLLPEKPSGK